MWTFHSCASLYPPPGGEARPQSSARRSGWGTALSFSTLPKQNGYRPPLTITPPHQRAAWEVREKSHSVMPEQTGKACCSSSISLQAQDRRQWMEGWCGAVEGRGRGRGWEEWGERERTGNKFVFSFSFQSATVCIYQSQVLLVRWTPSAVDTKYRPHEIVTKLNFKRTILSLQRWVNSRTIRHRPVSDVDNHQPLLLLNQRQHICSSSC